MVRLGIVGCGAVVRIYHMPAIPAVPAIRVSALCDLNCQQAVRLKKEFGLDAAVVTSLDDLAGRVDAALVAVNPRSHATVAIQLLDMGIDVLCEKPIASSSAEAERMIDAAARNGRRLAIGLWCRFLPNFRLLRTLAWSGVLGDLAEITAEFGGPLDWPMETAAYFTREHTAGGVLFETGIHMLDAIVWLFGDVSDITYEDDSLGGLEANAVLRGTLDVNGRAVPLRCAFSWTDPKRNGICIRGSRAVAMASPGTPEAVVIDEEIAGQPIETHVHRRGWDAGYRVDEIFRDQLKDFAEAVANRRDPVVTAGSAIGALRVIERAYAVRQPLAQPWLTPEAA
jgi:predicted dehydrogenase